MKLIVKYFFLADVLFLGGFPLADVFFWEVILDYSYLAFG